MLPSNPPPNQCEASKANQSEESERLFARGPCFVCLLAVLGFAAARFEERSRFMSSYNLIVQIVPHVPGFCFLVEVLSETLRNTHF